MRKRHHVPDRREMAKSTRLRRWLRYAALVVLGGGSLLAAQGAWIQAKAFLAQHLVAAAWERTLTAPGVHKPWPWADHWPIARISVPARGLDLVVLEGDSGNVLAFAPGHAVPSGLGGDDRAVVISGHRDTHFRFLEDLAPGERIRLETEAGRFTYRVSTARVVDSRAAAIRLDAPEERLLLVTCYPFDALRPGGPLRYVVTATRTRRE